ncbi:sulfur carrier protein ThiS [Phycisphaera mikurensis]|uniref:Thiazole biosynthesis protein ThiS n=1 Tax=Phycisphaera mikurensis (strain NBRC 102666 / KCTC 22515 / FYK2301M01) TaxID=1142394 RepID=I0IE88_PHYMF|nr:sulfur carrier protein ThiS [Phycisphaera mikurensis]MBB6441379.1 thiamine biosynthesis protein ThiS [Phycisphaera mikurensis]BAM03576.1 thiazole biosynthesis protein ThiS [Phycisphaera mikurensis NBRC 102666]
MPRLTVNGTPRDSRAATLADLVADLGLAGKPVAAERNGAVVPKREHAETALAENDTIELVTLVGGG